MFPCSRPELVPEERAVRLTEMLNHLSEKIYGTVQLHQHDATRLAFWMANASELLHFLKSDRHITSFSLQAQDILAETVHLAFKQLVLCLQNDLKATMPQMLQARERNRWIELLPLVVLATRRGEASFGPIE